MATHRDWLAAGALFVMAGFVGDGATAQKEAGGGRGRDDRTAKKTLSYTGKITRIGVEKRVLELSDLTDRGGASGGPGKGTDKGGTGKGGSGTGGAGGKGTGAGTGGGPGRGGRAVTFSVGEKATITLDGKAAGLKDLKVTHFARVHTDRATGTTTGTTAGKGAGGAGGAGRSMRTSKIEAFTKAPRGSGRGKGTGDRERGR